MQAPQQPPRQQHATHDAGIQRQPRLEAQDQLHALLDAQLRYGPEYGGGLSNHLPMALHALWALGADGSRLRTAFEHYRVAHSLPPAPPAGRVLTDWPAARGDITRFADLRATFDDLIARHGVQATLHRAVPLLWPGAVGAAFHGLIRTAHAVQARHKGEIAAGLAYWAARWLAVPAAAAHRPAPSFGDWSQALQSTAERLRPQGSLIAGRAADATTTPEYAELVASAPVLDGWSELADWAAALYARSCNFTVLHIATGTRAARVLSPWAGDLTAARSDFLRAAVAAALASHLVVDRPFAEPPDDLDWPAARAGAIDADDEHVTKLIHALDEARSVAGRSQDDRHGLAAAARALGRI